MKVFFGILLMLLSAGCLTTFDSQKVSEPVQADHLHEGGAHGFTQHYEKSFFQITDGGKYSVETVPVGGSLHMGDNSVDLIIHDRQDQDVAGASVLLTPWMPLHGHGSPETPVIVERGGGLYSVKNLYLPMAGPWEMRVTVSNNEIQDKTTFLLPVGMMAEESNTHLHTSKANESIDYTTTETSKGGMFVVTYVPEDGKNVLNRMQQWKIHLENRANEPVLGAKIKVSGGMPEHGHGLPSKPRVTKELGNGDYLVEGLKFTMPGWWKIVLKISSESDEENVTFNLDL